MKLTAKQKKEVLKLLRKAVALQAQRWDVEGDIEGVIGTELHHSEVWIKSLAVNVDPPGYSTAFVSMSDVTQLLRDNFQS